MTNQIAWFRSHDQVGGDNLLTSGCVVGRYRLTGTPSALQRNWRGYENHLNIRSGVHTPYLLPYLY